MKNIFLNLGLVLLLCLPSRTIEASSSMSVPWREISPQEMEKLLNRFPELRLRKIVQVDSSTCSMIIDPEEKKECEERKLEGISTQASVSTHNKDAAIIVFAIVGTVMIAVWIPYLAYLGYKLATKPEEVGVIHMLGANVVGMAKVGNAEGQASGGSFASTRYSFLMNSRREPNLAAGISAEVGYYSLTITESDSSKVEQLGSYWLAGPTVNFTLLPQFFLKLDLLAGRSFDSQLELFTKADISANLSLNDWIIGVGVSGLYFNIREQEGLLNRHSNASLGFSGSLGLRL